MSLKYIAYLDLWLPLCSAEWNHLCNFDRRHHGEQLCEIILNFDQWFSRRCHLKIFPIWSSGGPFVQQSRTICLNLVKSIIRNNSVKLFGIWASGSGGNVIKRHLLSRALVAPFVGWRGTICAIVVDGMLRNNSVNYFEFGPVVQQEM